MKQAVTSPSAVDRNIPKTGFHHSEGIATKSKDYQKIQPNAHYVTSTMLKILRLWTNEQLHYFHW